MESEKIKKYIIQSFEKSNKLNYSTFLNEKYKIFLSLNGCGDVDDAIITKCLHELVESGILITEQYIKEDGDFSFVFVFKNENKVKPEVVEPKPLNNINNEINVKPNLNENVNNNNTKIKRKLSPFENNEMDAISKTSTNTVTNPTNRNIYIIKKNAFDGSIKRGDIINIFGYLLFIIGVFVGFFANPLVGVIMVPISMVIQVGGYIVSIYDDGNRDGIYHIVFWAIIMFEIWAIIFLSLSM